MLAPFPWPPGSILLGPTTGRRCSGPGAASSDKLNHVRHAVARKCRFSEGRPLRRLGREDPGQARLCHAREPRASRPQGFDATLDSRLRGVRFRWPRGARVDRFAHGVESGGASTSIKDAGRIDPDSCGRRRADRRRDNGDGITVRRDNGDTLLFPQCSAAEGEG